ncbi:methionine-synthesizing 5- methyltetrahydropteroyltriglutamate--homocysteine methyltransferase [Entomortierella chlamydospora]|uniref:5-methyltetrahydropteroyltriglutamate--homocysteine S-methyltransferase n=1 Tax=Entomortierella chlamydospora TaxID=101097 RepID=A0A9P6N241_9FUNG|nr:methionine-synthesizing 5- methyltetrahydropteroyltriglutamate--homocysteine methyltransferase [Entomortierella chlamydospora]
MVQATNLGFPRIGAQRETKKIVESFWAGKVTEQAVDEAAIKLRAENWQLQKAQGLTQIPSGDFSFYDHVLDHSVMFNVIPQRFRHLPDGHERNFAIGRGIQKPATETQEKVDIEAQEMKKWFDTNYHYIVPEFEANQTFHLGAQIKTLQEFNEAKALGIHTRPVVLGPLSFLLLGKAAKNSPGLDLITLLPKVLPVYEELFAKLAQAGADWIQVDEPILALDQPSAVIAHFRETYTRLTAAAPSLKFLIATYFGRIDSNVSFIKDSGVAGLHIDLVRAPEQLEHVIANINNTQVLSLGLIDGRNIWKTNLANALKIAQTAVQALGSDRVFVAPSCSLLHTPVTLRFEKRLASKSPELFDWLAYSEEKCKEVQALNNGVESVQAELADNARSIEARRTSAHTTNSAVRQRLEAIVPDQLRRRSVFPERQVKQHEANPLPEFPTTTIGSFPQTKEIRLARAKFTKGEINDAAYYDFIKQEIAFCVQEQEKLGIDVLVHGEAERNDMVAYFGERLEGYIFSENGWIASYGSRCVRPPIIFGDVHRVKPMTVTESVYAQSLTKKLMKGMLTGPVTCLQWSFVRDDIPRSVVCTQLALAIRDEVADLEKANIVHIQVDEPAIREGLPLRTVDFDFYLQWAVDAFLLATTGVKDTTVIHTHMCYSDFQDIFQAIIRMDADVLTIENSKSDMRILGAFSTHGYTAEIGPGVFDIHSPRVPSTQEMKERADAMLKYIPRRNLWINPDCGLKTRGWKEVRESLSNMVAVAEALRASKA